MNVIQKLSLMLLCLLSSSLLFSFIDDYQKFTIHGKEVHLLGDTHVVCQTDTHEAQEFMRYLFSQEQYSHKMTFIIEGNEKSLHDFCISENWISATGQINPLVDWQSLLSSDVMLSRVRTAAFLFPEKINPQISVVMGDGRGGYMCGYMLDNDADLNVSKILAETVLMKKKILALTHDLSSHLKSEIKASLMSILNYINDIVLYFRHGQKSDFIKEYKQYLVQAINDLANLYFYAQVHTALLKNDCDKVVVYAGSDHTKVLAAMFACNEHNAESVKQADIYDIHTKISQKLDAKGPVKRPISIDYHTASIVSDVYPTIFGKTIDVCVKKVTSKKRSTMVSGIYQTIFGKIIDACVKKITSKKRSMSLISAGISSRKLLMSTAIVAACVVVIFKR